MFKSIAAVTLAVGVACSPLANAEPLSTIFEFSSSAYSDTLKTNTIVVTINRADQEPNPAETQPYTVECKLVPGSAVANDDYRMSMQWPASGIWKATFPPGVSQQSFTIYTVKKPGPNKTLHFALINPEGPGSAITGGNASTTITIVNPPPPPPVPDKKP
jgi:hypothetical protein